ncbi:MAG: class I SAM-dependent methyltransferase [Oscillospiraceae bacterium]|nr:class I SAM-dependent methyltransferase [Oscillospiraceae bacterium]
MFWSRIAGLYDCFENLYNKEVYRNTGKRVAEFIESSDDVLECACGTGAISVWIAERCKTLLATDFSAGMLHRAEKKCSSFPNVSFAEADITKLPYADNQFDKVVAGNVIHLLEGPKQALDELWRVTKPGGQIILPTYINKSKRSTGMAIRFLELLGAEFKQQFDMDTYKAFFRDLGYETVAYQIVDGRMPCAIAVLCKTRKKLSGGTMHRRHSPPGSLNFL